MLHRLSRRSKRVPKVLTTLHETSTEDLLDELKARSKSGVVCLGRMPKMRDSQCLLLMWTDTKMGFAPVAVGTSTGLTNMMQPDNGIPDE